MTTISWSPRVGQVWRCRLTGHEVTIEAEHTHAELVRFGGSGWLTPAALDAGYEPVLCESCGTIKREGGDADQA